ncbi:Uncharacterized conserved protein YloU, alkaline shock protein (Asp23) family [Thermomonospora echinospora]|uniref:Uncharacterized conserved protein YloU, alkaline shock protein (Asp23) family n=1 Tax=Thermomonospora echinospora TaxID=1992 RepID=A0A1H6DUZ8_9ACTN|nr:Asp23/Gls24 family envelope stress response protein [Thermomonospora echinospora]SEG89187.1 Uncharacterized conserved protein YloU, alkaline shock protein (Asp23) family [Thermomonospora echinospora]
MSDLDDSRAVEDGVPGSAPPPAAGPMPFFPAPPGRHATPPAGIPLSGSPSEAGAAGAMPPPLLPSQVGGRHQRHGSGAAGEPAAPLPAPPAEQVPPQAAAVVKGRITIEDEVIEKIAALAALEVDGVAAPSERAPGVRVHAQGNEVALDLAVVVEYGCVIMDVAKLVKTNVARVVSLMLGMRVTAVNVVVDDVRVPGEDVHRPGETAGRGE